MKSCLYVDLVLMGLCSAECCRCLILRCMVGNRFRLVFSTVIAWLFLSSGVERSIMKVVFFIWIKIF